MSKNIDIKYSPCYKPVSHRSEGVRPLLVSKQAHFDRVAYGLLTRGYTHLNASKRLTTYIISL